MPLTFAVAAVAIVSMSGLPPLARFGGKWLLLSAMMDKGWYGPIVMGLLATFVGFLYMARFMLAVFFGPRQEAHKDITEAPAALFVPQLLCIAGILVMSLFPKLLIGPISNAIDPVFASTLVWQGMSLEMIYGYWNPVPVMTFAAAVSAALFIAFWLVQRAGRPSGLAAGTLRAPRDVGSAGFFAFYKPVFATLTPPLATAFWDGISAVTMSSADRARRVYNGNGQIYGTYILCYFIVLYVVCGGLGHFGLAR